jgi:uncharacterized membrane protein
LDYFEGLKALHVLLAVIWVGGATTVQIFAIKAVRSPDPSEKIGLLRNTEWVGMRVYFPASVLLLIAGILMVVDRPDFAFGDAWILIGLGGLIFSAVVGSTFLGPETGRVGKLVEAKGSDDPEVVSRINRLFVVSRVELAILLLVVLDMVIKPGYGV